MNTTTQTEITQRNHHRAVRFFWGLLIAATTVSLTGNIAHAVLPYIPHVVVQIGAAAVPPIALLAAVHGIALAVRAGASGRVYCWAVGAVAAIGIGAFAVSFMALRDLMLAIGYSPTTACIFPAIIDTAVAVSTLMLVALGDKPARRIRTRTASPDTHPPALQRLARTLTGRAKGEVAPTTTSARAHAVQARQVSASASLQTRPAQAVQDSAQTEATHVAAGIAQVDADVASETDCIRCDHPACRDGDCGAGSAPEWRVDKRCRQGIWDQLQDGTADSGGCRRTPAATARGGWLTGHYVRCASVKDALALPRWLTVAQAAEYCGVDRAEMYYRMLGNLEVRADRRTWRGDAIWPFDPSRAGIVATATRRTRSAVAGASSLGDHEAGSRALPGQPQANPQAYCPRTA